MFHASLVKESAAVVAGTRLVKKPSLHGH